MNVASRLTRAARIVGAVAAGLLALAGTAAATGVEFHGLLDLVASQRGPAFEQNRWTRGDSPFDPTGVRLFAESKVNPSTEVFAQAVIQDASSVYLYSAYLTYTPFRDRDLHVLAGKIPWAIGTWEPRAYSNKNPLIGTPLMYTHHTSLVWYALPPNADALLHAAGTGSYGVDYEGYAMGVGQPIVDDSYWDVGVTLAGSQRPLEYALGVNAGTPGWASTTQDDNSGKSVLGRVGLAPLPGLRFGVSGAYGPYLSSNLDSRMPPGRNADDYHQKLAMADAEYLVGHVELRAEGARNFWETPTVGTLAVTGGYVEAKYLSPWGAYAATRYDVMRFGEISNSTGVREPWDDDLSRLETGLGLRFSRDVTGKLVYQRTHIDHDATATYRTLNLYAAQVSVAF